MLRLKRKLLIYLAIVVVPLSAASATGEQNYHAQYKAYVSGLKIANIDVQFKLPVGGYHLSANAQAAGVGRLFSSSSAESHSFGQITNGQLEPVGVSIAWKQSDEIRKSEISYTNGAPSGFYSDYALPPERQPKTPVALETVGRGTNDPFLAMLGQISDDDLSSVCRLPKRLFDGRRLANLRPQKMQLIAADEHGLDVAGPVVKCETKWLPVAGYSEKSMQNAGEFDTVSIYFARIAGTDYAAPVKAVTSTRYGRFTVIADKFFTSSETK